MHVLCHQVHLNEKLTMTLPTCPLQTIIHLQKEIQELKDELAIVTGEQRTEALTEAEILQ
jgi:hypothetical protein